MKKTIEKEYPDFLERLKFLIANSKVVKPEKPIDVIVDLSHWNENVNFKLAKEDGVVGVIHKATQGIRYVDPKYAERRKAAEDEGLLWGAYHFGVRENGIDQADHFLDTVGDTANVVLALDVEESTKSITLKETEDFITRIQEVTGRLPLIYGSAYFLFATPILTSCPLWIARWRRKPKLPKGWNKWILWQYTNGKIGPEPHSVEGIGLCDRNKFNGTLEELREFWLSGGKICC